MMQHNVSLCVIRGEPIGGDHGVCYIPYTYMCNSTYVWDLWTVREINDLEFGVNMINNALYGKTLNLLM